MKKKSNSIIQNGHQYCIRWSVIPHLYPFDGHKHRSDQYIEHKNVLKLERLQSPMKTKDNLKFEAKRPRRRKTNLIHHAIA